MQENARTDGTPIADMPVSKVRVQLTERGGGTGWRCIRPSNPADDMEQWVSMGTVEGLQQAVGQMDALRR